MQGQGPALGVGAGGDAVVCGGAEGLFEAAGGSRSREGGSSLRSNSAAGGGVQAGSGRSHGASVAVPARTTSAITS